MSILRCLPAAVKQASFFCEIRIAQGFLLLFVNGDLAMDEIDEAGFPELGDAAVYCLDAGANVVSDLLAAGMQDEEVGIDIAEPFEQIMLETFKARLKFDAAVLVGRRVHLGGQQPGNGKGEVIVELHPLQEGIGCHRDDFAGGQGFVGRCKGLLASQDLEVADEIRDVLSGKGITLAASKFIADARTPLGQDIDVIGAFPLADNGFAGQEDTAGRLAPDLFRHMLQHVVELHIK